MAKAGTVLVPLEEIKAGCGAEENCDSGRPEKNFSCC